MEELNYNKSVVFVDGCISIGAAVAMMINQKISCILVLDSKKYICGIVTERDIVRKFTLVSKENKLDSTVRSIMSYPVSFIQSKDLQSDLKSLLLKKKVRHFPIASTLKPKKEDILGILTVTDLAKLYLLRNGLDSMDLLPKCAVHLLSVRSGSEQEYIKILSELGFKLIRDEDLTLNFYNAEKNQSPIVIDLDCKEVVSINSLFQLVVDYNNTVVYLTSKPDLVSKFRIKLKNNRHHIMLKPIDFTLLSLILSNREESLEQKKII